MSPKSIFLLFPILTLLSGCSVSEEWGSNKIAYQSPNQQFPVNPTPVNPTPVNYAPSRSAAYQPVSYPVNPGQASSRVSAATGGSALISRSGQANLGGSQQATAIRDARVQQPVLVKPRTTFQPVSVPASVFPQAQVQRPVVQKAAPSRSFSGPRGKVRLVNGLAVAPSDAPAVVHRAVAAGNRLQKKPYKWGGGHARLNDDGYDCSGTVSYVLREAGLMKDQMTSRGFFNYGEAGEGDWITVWARDGHVFMVIGGLRLDTGGSTRRTGPRWKTKRRSYKDLVPRHPSGL